MEKNVLFCLENIYECQNQWMTHERRKQKFIVKLLILCRSLYLSYHISHALVITAMCYAIITSLSIYKTFNVFFSAVFLPMSPMTVSTKAWNIEFSYSLEFNYQHPSSVLISLFTKMEKKRISFRVLKISPTWWIHKKRE